jgi:hypothetical protein
MMMKTALMCATVALGLGVGSVHADTAKYETNVNRILVDGTGTYGGCMALLSVALADQLPACLNGWVTFSCTGEHVADPVLAYRMLDQAQLALATGKRVAVYVTDSKTHNGYCHAYRIDVYK